MYGPHSVLPRHQPVVDGRRLVPSAGPLKLLRLCVWTPWRDVWTRMHQQVCARLPPCTFSSVCITTFTHNLPSPIMSPWMDRFSPESHHHHPLVISRSSSHHINGHLRLSSFSPRWFVFFRVPYPLASFSSESHQRLLPLLISVAFIPHLGVLWKSFELNVLGRHMQAGR
ncbi:hypothetical protein BDN67DRAFT_68201 [Paxillus ammoniavirescens]|nr:hypothetical protein BDN67DRAFT_68201 [Paxillus ammoniavirescens]